MSKRCHFLFYFFFQFFFLKSAAATIWTIWTRGNNNPRGGWTSWSTCFLYFAKRYQSSRCDWHKVKDLHILHRRQWTTTQRKQGQQRQPKDKNDSWTPRWTNSSHCWRSFAKNWFKKKIVFVRSLDRFILNFPGIIIKLKPMLGCKIPEIAYATSNKPIL